MYVSPFHLTSMSLVTNGTSCVYARCSYFVDDTTPLVCIMFSAV